MNTLKLLELQDSVYFTEDVYIDKKFLLVVGGTCFSSKLKSLLREWQFTNLYTEGSCLESPPEEVIEKTEEKPQSKLDAVKSRVQNDPQSGMSIAKTYGQFLAFTKKIYEGYQKNKTLELDVIMQKMTEFVEFVQNNKQSILILQTILPYDVDDFLIAHSLRTAVFALVIGIQLDLSSAQLRDLSISSLLHDIGLMHIPQEIYSSDAKLTEDEKKYLHVHPVLSCKILKKSKFALPICLGALDHHECENGTGYPQHLTGEKISRYGKIIAVACSYEAAIAPRRYKEPYEPAEGLLNLFMHKQTLYDDEVLKALLCALSFFPIGSFVILSDTSIAQVIDTNPEDPRAPVVRIIGSPADSANGEVLQTSMSGMSITRAARREEWEAALARKK